MATYDLTQSQLNSLLASDNIDPSVRKSIIDYLKDDGLLNGPGSKVAVQESGYPPTLDPNAQVLLVDTLAGCGRHRSQSQSHRRYR